MRVILPLSFLLLFVIPAKAGIQACLHRLAFASMTEVGKYDKEEEDGFPNFTNEVQHLYKVLLWEKDTINLPLKSGVKLPDYVPRSVRSGKSLQLWIARHRQLLER
jgi:hypothetical protein